MGKQDDSQGAGIHEGGYGAPMPEDEMPNPAAAPDAADPPQQEDEAGVEPLESDAPDGRTTS